jgi:hypothetical protein
MTFNSGVGLWQNTEPSKAIMSFTVKQPSRGSTARRLAEAVRMIITKPTKNM